MSTTAETIRTKYKRAFLKGLATLLPTVLTAYIILWTFNFIDQNVASPMNAAIKTQLQGTERGREIAVRFLEFDPELAKPGNEERLARAIDEEFPAWVGIAAAVVAVFLVGFFVAGFLGRRLWYVLELWLHRLPVVKSIYPSAKQIVDFFVKHDDDKGPQFSRVVLAPFPGEDQMTIAFVMSEAIRDLEVRRPGRRYLNVFIPMSPTPVMGFVIFVPEDCCYPVDMSVDEALKFYVTCGLAVPVRQMSSIDRARLAGAGAGGVPSSAPGPAALPVPGSALAPARPGGVRPGPTVTRAPGGAAAAAAAAAVARTGLQPKNGGDT